MFTLFRAPSLPITVTRLHSTQQLLQNFTDSIHSLCRYRWIREGNVTMDQRNSSKWGSCLSTVTPTGCGFVFGPWNATAYTVLAGSRQRVAEA
jgi:hypothetical protein